ncbi:MarR family winged helix-turn-helix transcriptional regulator [Paenibacillus sp. S150]|uniref:MarR family winged helix-turn-helix transcriptional regulator n=1 Tax=Paenibacillus sp. S150 TaxID=2749826 RepID=UPI001C55E48A|nr:MarR family transcriptional regulator [Paenibacillus sp. S150]MBW4080580.1 MarR family transcriptional regulator [Paenibacillus sp. S150]
MENEKIIRAFGILNRTFVSFISKSLSAKDLSYSDSIFLVNIGDNEGTTQEELAHFLAIDKAAIARSVKNMEGKGYVRTGRSKADKRAKELYLSESGKELYQYMQLLNHQWINQLLGDLDPDEIKKFNQTIDLISSRAKSL